MIEYIGGTGVYILGWYAYWYRHLRHARKRILAFHSISNRFELSITRNTVNGFEDILDYFKQEEFEICDLSEINEHNQIALTFDDGWQDFYDNAFPLLKERGYSATVFLISDYVGKKSNWDYQSKQHLSWETIREMSEHGIEFGSHSRSHVDLRSLDNKALNDELLGSKKVIEDKLGKPVRYFSYPFGRYNERVTEAAAKAGYQSAYSLSTGFDDFSIARHAAYLYDTPYSIYQKIVKQSWLEMCKDYINNSLAGGTIALKKMLPANDRGKS